MPVLPPHKCRYIKGRSQTPGGSAAFGPQLRWSDGNLYSCGHRGHQIQRFETALLNLLGYNWGTNRIAYKMKTAVLLKKLSDTAVFHCEETVKDILMIWNKRIKPYYCFEYSSISSLSFTMVLFISNLNSSMPVILIYEISSLDTPKNWVLAKSP